MDNVVQIGVFKENTKEDILLYSFLARLDLEHDFDNVEHQEYLACENALQLHGKGHYTISQAFDKLNEDSSFNMDREMYVLSYPDLKDPI